MTRLSPPHATSLFLATLTLAGAARAAEASTASSPAAPASTTTASPTPPAQGSQDNPSEPFAFADFTWVAGNARTTESPLSTEAFTAEFRADVDYVYSFNHPKDDTIGGSSEVFRHGEVQVTQLGIGGDFHHDDVQGRLMTQFGMYSQTTPRNDASTGRGQWNLADAYRYISEAYGGYHLNVMHGINVQAGIFMSYVGLWSYYNFDNWSYQPSFVSSNTPWFFNGLRVQFFPTDKLKIEPWIVNGWQSYGRFNSAPGIGLQIKWTPTGWISITANQYYGKDTLGLDRMRIHTDDSIVVKVLDRPESFVSKAAVSLTLDAGCEWGGYGGTANGTLTPAGPVACMNGTAAVPAQFFLGFMAYTRLWFDRDLFGFTIGGGAVDNPGRYLVLLPPINGATAATGTPYFPEGPGQQFEAWDTETAFDYLPNGYLTFRIEYDHRVASVPYFSGHLGVTPIVNGVMGNTGLPGSAVPGWAPNLVPTEDRVTLAMLVKL